MKYIVTLILMAVTSFAEDIYVSQNGAGSKNGSSVANAAPLSFFNTKGNWAAGDGKISPGDTVHITGVFNFTGTSPGPTNQFQFQGGGTPGNPITLKFDVGGRIRHPTGLPTGMVTGIGTSMHDIVVEGANLSPVKVSTTQIDIEVFDNGTKLGNQVDGNRLMFFDGALDNITIKNVYFFGAYVREYGNTVDQHASANILSLRGHSNLIIDNCRAEYAEGGLSITGLGPVSTNLRITNSYIYGCSTAIKLGGVHGGVNDGVYILGNRIDGFGVWAGLPAPNQHHCDGIQTISPKPDTFQKNVHVAYNHIGPDLGLYGSMNAHIFLEDLVHGAFVYNNLLTANSTPLNPAQGNKPPGTANGFVTITGGESTMFADPNGIRSLVANNTLVGAGRGQGLNVGFSKTEGNIVYSTDTMVALWDRAADNAVHGPYFICDKNIYFMTNPDYQWGVNGVGSGVYSFASWKSTFGYDLNSLVTDPMINGLAGTLKAGSPAINFAPTQTLFSDDINGNRRTPPWDAGAFEYGSVPGPTPVPTPTPSPTAAPSPTPPAPTLSFALAWNSVPNAANYRVYENGAVIAETANTAYSLEGKTGPKNYQVTAVNVSGESPKSNQVTLPAPSPTPNPSPTPSPSATPIPIPAAPVLQINQS